MDDCRGVDIGIYWNISTMQFALYQKMGFEIQEIWKNYFVNNYPEAIFEHGIQCKDMIRLSMDLGS